MAFTQEDYDSIFGPGAVLVELPQDHNVVSVMENALAYAAKTSRNPDGVKLSDFENIRVGSIDPNQSKAGFHVATEINQLFKNSGGAVKQSSEREILRNDGESLANELVAFAKKPRETET